MRCNRRQVKGEESKEYGPRRRRGEEKGEKEAGIERRCNRLEVKGENAYV